MTEQLDAIFIYSFNRLGFAFLLLVEIVYWYFKCDLVSVF